MKRPNKTWMIVGVIAAALAIVGVGFVGEGRRLLMKTIRQRRLAENQGGKKQGPAGLPFEMPNGLAEFGPPDAAVRVVAFIPSASSGGCGNETATSLQELHDANPDRIFVQVVDFESAEGARLQTETGTHCAGLVINGQQKVKVNDPASDGLVEVSFDSNLGDKWSMMELITVLDHEFNRAYGEPCIRPGATEPPPGPSADEAAPPAEGGDSA